VFLSLWTLLPVCELRGKLVPCGTEFTCLGGKASLIEKGIGDEMLLARIESQSGEWLANNLDQRSGDNK